MTALARPRVRRWKRFRTDADQKPGADVEALCRLLMREEPGDLISADGWTIIREIEKRGWYVAQSRSDRETLNLIPKPAETDPRFGMMELEFGAPEGPGLSAHALATLLKRAAARPSKETPKA